MYFCVLHNEMKILLIDNYDSFTWNLYQQLEKAGASSISVIYNDKVSNKQVRDSDAIVFSPGPGLPSEAGMMPEIIRTYSGSKKMLGICLGHQAIAETFGAKLEQAGEIFHGSSSSLNILLDCKVFRNLQSGLQVGRYHSWIVSKTSFPAELEITATDQDGVIMALQHKTLDITGLQFHPESILTPAGIEMIKNWMHS